MLIGNKEYTANDIKNNKCFYVTGKEYDYNYIHIFLDCPEKFIDESGSCYYTIKWIDENKEIHEYFGIRIPKYIAMHLGFPDFDGKLGFVKIDMNINDYFSKKGFVVNENFKLELI